MDIKDALKGQYHAGLAMLRETIEKCPEDLWYGGEHPRNTWRIAYHVTFYTHLYLAQTMDSFIPWPKGILDARILWSGEDGSPAPVVEAFSKTELLEYVDFVDAGVDGWVDALDLETLDPGFHWYSIPKLDHQILNIRHLGVHTGQLAELVMATGADLDWVSKR